jgi:hypothetical protein
LAERVRAAKTPETQLSAVASQYGGETAYVFTCGPSLADVWSEKLSCFLEDKLVIAVKRAFDLMPAIVDYHVFNRCHHKDYQYPDPVPIRLAVEIEPFTQMVDIRLPFLSNPNQKYLHSVLYSRSFERWELSRSSARCYGPGIMFELGIYLPVHLGCKQVVFFGWDMNPVDSAHFYNPAQDMAPVHLEEHVLVANSLPQLIPDLTKWFHSRGMDAYLCSPRSAIPLPQLSVQEIIRDSPCRTRICGAEASTVLSLPEISVSTCGVSKPVVVEVNETHGLVESPIPAVAVDGRFGKPDDHAGSPSLRTGPVFHPWMPFIQVGHFTVAPTEVDARALFKSTVQMVEIEVHSFCNRKCWFCSNTVVDRQSVVHLMAPALYRSILNQLAGIQYDKMISFSRYNEPFSQPVIFDRIAEARSLLPHAVLHANTNGDYLKPDTLRAIADAGLNSLNVQCYLKDSESYNHEKVKSRFGSIVKRLGIEVPVTKDVPNEWFEGAGRCHGMDVRVYGRNFAVNGTSRGETVAIAPEYVRRSPCLSPFWHFYVDWNGCVMPCCNLRSEVPAHHEAILATLTPESSLFRAFAGETARSWRQHLASFDPKAGLCRSCRFVTTEYDAALETQMRLLMKEARRKASDDRTSQSDQPIIASNLISIPMAAELSPARPPGMPSPQALVTAQPSAPPRFLSFLLPYIDRGYGPICQWIMEFQAACLGPDGVAFIGDDSYFQAALPWGEEMDISGFCYRCPTPEEWEKFSRHALPRTIFADLEHRSRSMLDAFRILLTEDYAPLREALEALLAGICGVRKPDAILSWCHVPSLKLAAAKFGIPIIHNELGPLRAPNYQSTVYFDFNGVNGFTSAAEQMHQFVREAAGWTDFHPLALAELRDLLIVRADKGWTGASLPTFEAGVALQVEDDSNLLAFSNGMSNFELINAVRRFAGREQILFRHHPHGHAHYSEKLGAVDQSADSIEFLSRCKHLFTTNSSLAFEGLLQGRPVTILGDSPAAGLSHPLFQAMSPEMRLLCLNWLFVGHLVPAARLFDADYYRWRLTHPPLREIFERHLSEFQAEQGKRFQASPDLQHANQEVQKRNPTLTELNQWRSPIRESLHRRISELEKWNQKLTEGNQWLAQNRKELESRVADMEKWNQKLTEGNQWLTQNRESLESRVSELEKWNHTLQHQVGSGNVAQPEGSQAYFLIPHLDKALRSKGQPDQVAIWDATIDGASARAIYLQPPAELTFELPTGARGKLVTAVALHPDAWEKPNAGGCEFHLRIDGRQVFVVALDSAHLLTDRHWHELSLDIPENSQGTHRVTFETRGIGSSNECRWALWRTPKFVWTAPSKETAEALI